ncbi:unnamed protein product [Boreogadus saida]
MGRQATDQTTQSNVRTFRYLSSPPRLTPAPAPPSNKIRSNKKRTILEKRHQVEAVRYISYL